jgi:hypothetical protein
MYYGLVKYELGFDILGYSDVSDLEIIQVGKASKVNRAIEREIKKYYLNNLLKKKNNYNTYIIYETKSIVDNIDNFYAFRTANKILDMTLMYNDIFFGGCKNILDRTVRKIDSVNALSDLFATIKEFQKKHKSEIQYYIARNHLPVKQNKSKKEILKRLELYNKTMYYAQYLNQFSLTNKLDKKDKKRWLLKYNKF